MEQQESADDAGGSTDAAPIDWLDEILPVDPGEDKYMIPSTWITKNISMFRIPSYIRC